MLTTGPVSPVGPAPREERRQHPRRRLDRLAYIHFDKDNGGVLLDVGEGGLKFQSIASSRVGELCVVKFTLPGAPRTIEVRGQIAWSNSSRKGGGVRFRQLPEDVRLQIREWMSQETPSLIAARPVATKPITAKDPVFRALTLAQEEAGKPPSMVNEPAMPTLNVVPVVPEVRVEPPSSISSLSVKAIAESKAPDKIAEIVPDVAGTPLADQPLPEPSQLAEPILIAELGRVAAPVAGSAWSKPEKFRRSESFLIAGLDKATREDDRPKRSSRVARGLIVAATACAVALANLLDPRVLAAKTPELPIPAQPPAGARASFRQAVLIHSVQATYPVNITPSNLDGLVRVSATIDKEGVPGSLKMVSGDPRLSAAALAAVGEWRYDPALLNGEPVESTILITMNFQPRK